MLMDFVAISLSLFNLITKKKPKRTVDVLAKIQYINIMKGEARWDAVLLCS